MIGESPAMCHLVGNRYAVILAPESREDEPMLGCMTTGADEAVMLAPTETGCLVWNNARKYQLRAARRTTHRSRSDQPGRASGCGACVSKKGRVGTPVCVCSSEKQHVGTTGERGVAPLPLSERIGALHGTLPQPTCARAPAGLGANSFDGQRRCAQHLSDAHPL